MTATKCRRCGHYWTFAGNPELFSAISKWCPLCVPKVLPVMGQAPTSVLKAVTR